MRENKTEQRVEMDYIYLADGEPILIERIQKGTREEIIAQYVAYRKAKKLTQAELAERTGMARTNITRFESGNYNPTLEMMVKIASALDLKLKLTLEDKEAVK